LASAASTLSFREMRAFDTVFLLRERGCWTRGAICSLYFLSDTLTDTARRCWAASTPVCLLVAAMSVVETDRMAGRLSSGLETLRGWFCGGIKSRWCAGGGGCFLAASATAFISAICCGVSDRARIRRSATLSDGSRWSFGGAGGGAGVSAGLAGLAGGDDVREPEGGWNSGKGLAGDLGDTGETGRLLLRRASICA